MSQSGRSRALLLSVLLHAFFLLGLGTGTAPGTVSEQGVLAVYLALPSAATERIFDPQANPGKMNVTQPVHTRAERRAPSKSGKVAIQPAVETVALDEDPVPVPVRFEEPEMSVRPFGEIPDPLQSTAALPQELPGSERTISRRKSEPLNVAAGKDPLLETNDNTGDEDISAHGSPITDHRAALFAFADDPAALGMIAHGALVPGLEEAVALSLPEPAYPVFSRKRGEEGRVVVGLTISAKGGVRRAEIIESSTHPRLDRAALEAVKKAAFRPATVNGCPVESVTKAAYRFELKK